jgi:hypothetical protein
MPVELLLLALPFASERTTFGLGPPPTRRTVFGAAPGFLPLLALAEPVQIENVAHGDPW